ncbi:hypothetical protein AB4Y36_38255 [Paraburkholderia sp. BR10936]|uniref:hypothetical protein n=1 Tax=Paraburkholderia sp. BR10936 TaxID=3236993 RepID=UPI0034D19B76
MNGLTSSPLIVWTVYDSPREYPGFFVARAHVVNDGVCYATMKMYLGLTLEEVRRQLPAGLVRFPREHGDEPQIVESWL